MTEERHKSEDRPIRVLLADDHTMFREGLAGVFSAYAGMDVVANVPNDEEALRLARGLSNAQIASSLYLAGNTVKRHLANVYEKMEVTSRNEAAREALLKEWITIEEVTSGTRGRDREPLFYPDPSAPPASSEAAFTVLSRSSVEAFLSSVTRPSALRRASMPSE